MWRDTIGGDDALAIKGTSDSLLAAYLRTKGWGGKGEPVANNGWLQWLAMGCPDDVGRLMLVRRWYLMWWIGTQSNLTVSASLYLYMSRNAIWRGNKSCCTSELTNRLRYIAPKKTEPQILSRFVFRSQTDIPCFSMQSLKADTKHPVLQYNRKKKALWDIDPPSHQKYWYNRCGFWPQPSGFCSHFVMAYHYLFGRRSWGQNPRHLTMWLQLTILTPAVTVIRIVGILCTHSILTQMGWWYGAILPSGGRIYPMDTIHGYSYTQQIGILRWWQIRAVHLKL